MTGRPITTWGACARCVHGSADGTQCTAPQLRVVGLPQPSRTDAVRREWCGLQAQWHVYRPAQAGVAPLLSAA